jgi:DNA polymerase III subunit gamma/tau
MSEIRKSLYLKYRPQNFDSLVGQDNIQKILKAATIENKISQAYLLMGPRGTGKTTTARLIAKVLNCSDLKDYIPCDKCNACISIQEGNFMDVIEIDAASNTGVDEMRNLIEKAHFSPGIGKKKVFIIDEVHMLSKSAFNALLKTLEEPPSHVHFILATTEVNKVPSTIISRCQRFDFRRISEKDIVKRLIFICNEENIKFEEKALHLIAKTSDGGMRDAISLLEKVLIKNELSLDNVENSLGIVRLQVIEEFVNLILGKKTSLALQYIDNLYQDGVSLIQFKKEILEYLRQKILETIQEKEIDKMKINRLLKIIDEFNNININSFIIPQFPFEIVIFKLTLSEDKIYKIEEDKLENKTDDSKKFSKVETIHSSEEYKFTSEDLPEKKFTVRPTLESIRDDWNKVLDDIKNSTLKFALREVFLEKFENDILEISFNSEFQFSKINNNETKSIIEDSLKNLFNIPIKIKMILSKIEVKKEKQEKETEDLQKDIKKDEVKNGDNDFIEKANNLFQ